MLVRVTLWVMAIFTALGMVFVASLPRVQDESPAIEAKMPSLQDLIAQSPTLAAGDLEARCPVESIALDRTVCFGNCPIYTVTFLRSGKAEYVGKENVERVGRYEGELALRDFARLCQLADEADFATLKDEYWGMWSDAPFAIVTVKTRGRTRKVFDHDESGPSKLWALQQALDGMASRTKWKAEDAGSLQ